jgi:hypothetical protein
MKIHCIMIKWSIKPENIIVNVNVPNPIALDFVSQSLLDIKGEMGSNTVLLVSFIV